MKLHSKENFLEVVRFPVPEQGFTAFGIHPSSEVDLVIVDGHVLGVGAVVPVSPNASHTVEAFRRPCIGDNLFGTEAANITNAEGDQNPGGKLVLQCYEPCDQLIPPGPRLPVFKSVEIAAADLPTTAEGAQLAMRIPFHGRRQASIGMWRSTNAADLSMLVVGRSYGNRRSGLGAKPGIAFTDVEGVYHEADVETWFNGGVAADVVTTIEAGVYKWRVVQFGAQGDAEAYDELQVFVWGAAGGLVRLYAEAFGERV